ncbi:hypothetical protein Kisp01_67330 [Kineosporia sp. NBRC 101677]|nr:hypothetical protein Kisp01_67330 [Kineosporia sp. NBRC 101677]
MVNAQPTASQGAQLTKALCDEPLSVASKLSTRAPWSLGNPSGPRNRCADDPESKALSKADEVDPLPAPTHRRPPAPHRPTHLPAPGLGLIVLARAFATLRQYRCQSEKPQLTGLVRDLANSPQPTAQ